MPDFDYKKMFAEAKAELERLQTAKANTEEHLAQLSAKISALTQTANAIAPLIGELTIPMLKDPFVSPVFDKAAGITMAVRTLFELNLGKSFTAAMVRQKLEEQGWDWSNYVNPLSTIHTVLRRLEEAQTVKRVNPSTLAGVLGGVRYCSTKPPLLPFLEDLTVPTSIGELMKKSKK